MKLTQRFVSSSFRTLFQQHAKCDPTSELWGRWGIRKPYSYLSWGREVVFDKPSAQELLFIIYKFSKVFSEVVSSRQGVSVIGDMVYITK